MIRKIRIGELGVIITGNTPPRKKPEYYGTSIPFIKATDIDEASKYTHTPEEFYSEIGYQKYRKSLIPKGSTCVVTIGSVGKKMTMACRECFINQAMNAIVPSESYDPEYVYYVVKYNLHKLKSLDSGTASGRENISKSAFSNLEIDVIDNLETQRKIGLALSAYDLLIENNQKQIKLLEEAAQRLYKEWFVDLHFPSYEDTRIIDGVPEGWVRGTLADIIKETGNRISKDNRESYTYYLPIDCLPKKSLAYIESNTIELAESSLIAFKTGDIIFGAMRPYFHKVVVARDDGITRTTCLVLNAKDREYWAYAVMLMFSCNTIEYATKISVGTTMPYTRWKDLSEMPVLIPRKEVAICFGENIGPIIAGINRLAKQVTLLQRARDGLLPKLMSGEIEHIS